MNSLINTYIHGGGHHTVELKRVVKELFVSSS